MRPKHDAARGWLLSLIAALCLMFMLFDSSAQAMACASPPHQSRPATPAWREMAATATAANPHSHLDTGAHVAGSPL